MKGIKGITVAFEENITGEYAEKIIETIKMLRYVSDVKPVEETHEDYFVKSQLKHEWIMKFYDFIKNELK
jgi:hypothetical protein